MSSFIFVSQKKVFHMKHGGEICGAKMLRISTSYKIIVALLLNFVDLRGIEPLPQQCECCVMPFYYRPKSFTWNTNFTAFVWNRPVIRRGALSNDRANSVYPANHLCRTIQIWTGTKTSFTHPNFYFRAAENRTRSTCSQSRRTTIIRQPDNL